MPLKLGINELDEILGGVVERSLILIHEADPRSLGKFLAFEIMRRKLDSDNLVGYFNIDSPLSITLSILEKVGLDWRRHLHEGRLMIIDTFGSIYDTKTDLENVWYLRKPIDIDTLNEKYIKVIGAHKQKWAEMGMFEGRELWGVTVSMSNYLSIFTPKATQRYLEISDLQRRKSEVYIKYPAGTNVWTYTGDDTIVLPLLYRKADYILKTESRIEDGKVKRYLHLIKNPKLGAVSTLEYKFKGGRIRFV